MRSRLKPKSFLDPSRRDWQFEVFAWLLRHCGGYPKFTETPLVLPNQEYFPDRGLKGQAGISALFRRVREHCGMQDWPCTVAAESGAPREPDGEADGLRVITYPRGSLEAIGLLAHFAREMGRYLVETFDVPAPGDDSLREGAVELAAVFLGFGIFMANSAADGARYALSEGELAHALALFCLLGKQSTECADEHLNPHLRKHVRLAARDLAQFEVQFQRLRVIGPVAADEAGRLPPVRAV
jgi:hypothetical protein